MAVVNVTHRPRVFKDPTTQIGHLDFGDTIAQVPPTGNFTEVGMLTFGTNRSANISDDIVTYYGNIQAPRRDILGSSFTEGAQSDETISPGEKITWTMREMSGDSVLIGLTIKPFTGYNFGDIEYLVNIRFGTRKTLVYYNGLLQDGNLIGNYNGPTIDWDGLWEIRYTATNDIEVYFNGNLELTFATPADGSPARAHIGFMQKGDTIGNAKKELI